MSQLVYLKNSATSSLRVCRGCLATDARMYDMRQNRLMEAYSTLLNTAVKVTDELPHYLCSYCATLLLKCVKFRNKCIDALFILKNAQLKNVLQSTDYIINRSASNFERGQTETVDIISETIHIINVNLKQEHDIDTPSDPDDVKDTNHVFDDHAVTHSINTDHEYDIENQNNQINKLLNKFIEDKGSPLLKDFDVNKDVSNEDRIKELSEIVKHIQYASETSNEFFNILDNDSSDVSKYITETTQGNVTHNKPKNRKSVMTKQTKGDVIANTINVSLKVESLTVSDCKSDVENEVSNEIATPIPEDNTTFNISNKIEVSIEPMDSSCDKTESNVDLEDNIADMKKKKKTKRKSSVKDEQYGFKGLLKILQKPQKKDKGEGISESIKQKAKEFEEKYKFNVTYLSKDEQIKEIEDRKESKKHKQMKFKCNLCYRGFNNEEIYNNHKVLHDDLSGKFVCDICQFHFTSPAKVKKHKWSHSQVFTCQECGHKTNHSHLAIQHSKWHTGNKFSCKECGKEFKNNSSRYGHIKLCHPTSEQLLRCEICEDSFNGPIGLSYHDKKAHKEMRSPECYCSVCETQFYCSDALKAHQGTAGLCITTHKYCVRCGMAFDTDELLKEHEIEQRKPRDHFECEVCNREFTNYTSYNTHRATHGAGRRRRSNNIKKLGPSMCELCGVVFKNDYLLNLHHRKTHLNLKPYQCANCPKSFNCNMSLKLHSNVHTGERPYKCTICSKGFGSPGNRDRHALVHSGERPHLCNICGKRFQTSGCVKAHVKYVHMKVPLKPRNRRRKTTATQ